MVRKFYANAYPTDEHPFCYTTSVASKDVHFDGEIINDYKGIFINIKVMNFMITQGR